MGKKRITIIGDTDTEEESKKQRQVERDQKKLREHAQKPKDETSRVKSLESQMEAEAETVARKLKEADESIKAKSDKPKFVQPRKRGKNYLTARIRIDHSKHYPVDEAVRLLKSLPQPKFPPTVELHINCIQKGINYQVELPFSTGKVKRTAIADDATIVQIEAGKIDFDILFASPEQMPKLAKLAKILGPKGLMPNPKTGNIAADPVKAAKNFADSPKVTIRTEPNAPIIHTIIGKITQEEAQLTANISSILTVIKPQNIRSVYIKSTMSPAIKVDID